MDSMIYDELLQEIFSKLSNSVSSAIPLVSKRWLYLYRCSRTGLSIKLSSVDRFTILSLRSFLSQHPFLSSLTIISTSGSSDFEQFNDQLLKVASSFSSCLSKLRFLAGPPSFSSLIALSSSCSLLCSLTIPQLRPFDLFWVAFFPRLKELTICVLDGESMGAIVKEVGEVDLELETICFSGLRKGDTGVGWLWRSCKKLRKLKLTSCESVGDGGSFLWFNRCLKSVEKLELRTSRSLVSAILLKLGDNCESINSLLIYDGGSAESLLNFIRNCRFPLKELDFRLPLDLNNHHLMAASSPNFKGLVSLKLQSCCLVTGEGLKALGVALNSGLEELGLINCDVVGEESGLLASLGQHMKKLRVLDLSYNELLIDKELTSMLVSLTCLVELKLRGCKRLTNVATMCMLKNCKRLKYLDVLQCPSVGTDSIQLLLANLKRLALIRFEDRKMSDSVRSLAARKFVRVEDA